jgi:hypothetical protein
MRIVECPKCGADISETYQSAEPDVGIIGSGWFCDACEEFVEDDGDDFDFYPEDLT